MPPDPEDLAEEFPGGDDYHDSYGEPEDED